MAKEYLRIAANRNQAAAEEVLQEIKAYEARREIQRYGDVPEQETNRSTPQQSPLATTPETQAVPNTSDPLFRQDDSTILNERQGRIDILRD
jgi:hypothetical protein